MRLNELVKFKKGGNSKDKVSQKISKLMNEGKSQDQAVAIALSMKNRGELEEGGEIDEATYQDSLKLYNKSRESLKKYKTLAKDPFFQWMDYGEFKDNRIYDKYYKVKDSIREDPFIREFTDDYINSEDKFSDSPRLRRAIFKSVSNNVAPEKIKEVHEVDMKGETMEGKEHSFYVPIYPKPTGKPPNKRTYNRTVKSIKSNKQNADSEKFNPPQQTEQKIPQIKPEDPQPNLQQKDVDTSIKQTKAPYVGLMKPKYKDKKGNHEIDHYELVWENTATREKDYKNKKQISPAKAQDLAKKKGYSIVDNYEEGGEVEEVAPLWNVKKRLAQTTVPREFTGKSYEYLWENYMKPFLQGETKKGDIMTKENIEKRYGKDNIDPQVDMMRQYLGQEQLFNTMRESPVDSNAYDFNENYRRRIIEDLDTSYNGFEGVVEAHNLTTQQQHEKGEKPVFDHEGAGWGKASTLYPMARHQERIGYDPKTQERFIEYEDVIDYHPLLDKTIGNPYKIKGRLFESEFKAGEKTKRNQPQQKQVQHGQSQPTPVKENGGKIPLTMNETSEADTNKNKQNTLIKLSIED